jgi:transposase
MVDLMLEAQRQTILHYWLKGIHSAKTVHKKAGIPLRTVERNFKKLRETGTVEHKRENGRPSKVVESVSRAIGQHVRRDTAVSTRQLAVKVLGTQGTSVSHAAIWRHMKRKGYLNSLPLGTPMLTDRHLETRKAWAQAHMQDNWGETIFTNETAFDLFRNKVRQ